jgi:tRNA modification GTPase
MVKEGARVLLCGEPNAGKSSLLNLVLGKKRAIVSPVSGTTRDLIEEEASLAGQKFVFCDSAGIRETSDEIERIGVELAKERIPWADLVLLVADATDESDRWREVFDLLKRHSKRVWLIVNKIDLAPSALTRIATRETMCERSFFISAKTGAGIGSLIEALVEDVARNMPERGDVGEVITNERHRDCLRRAEDALARFVESVASKRPVLTILVADVREALTALDEIVGKTYTEDILGRIFTKFCVGK